MANIVKRSQPERRVAPAMSVWDPFRAMREMLSWDPLSETLPGYAGRERGYLPTFDVKETKDAYVFKADLPGVKEENIDVSLTGNQLTISGHREEEHKEEGEQYYASERSYGSFTRTFSLPDGCDTEHVSAESKDGVLTLSIPKRAELQARKIPIGKQHETKAKA